MTYLWSDLHWGHEAIIRLSNRIFKDVNEMNEELVRIWNNTIKPEDTVWVLGDMSFMPFKEFEPIAKRLNGIKKLVQGNHDHYSVSQYNRLGFEVFQEVVIKIGGKRVRLSHYPYAPNWWQRLFAYKSELRYLDKRPVKVYGEHLLHGHTHSKTKKNGAMIHVGFEAWGRPVSINEIESLINKI